MNLPIETLNLLIRKFSPSDAEKLYKNHLDSQTKRWFPNEAYETVDEAMGAALFYQKHVEQGSLPFVLAVELKSTGELIGDSGISRVEGREDQVEIGYLIEEMHRGNGYATELLNSVTDFVAESFEVSEILARVLCGNNASSRVLEKCGYIFVDKEMNASDDPYGNGILIYKKTVK